MHVNSSGTGFFNKRMMLRAGIAFFLLGIFFTTSSFKTFSDRDIRAKQLNIIIRQIGHRLLLQGGDSTSRVLPVTEIKEGTFLLRFENEFVFNHDSLIVLAKGLLPKTQFPSGYSVTVHDCSKRDIVYGFQVNNATPDILACSGRSQPAGCYTIEFAFPDFYKDVEEKKAFIDPRTQSAKIDPQVNPGEFKTAMLDNGTNERNREGSSANIDRKAIDPNPAELTMTNSNFPLINVIYGGVLVLLCVALLVVHFRKTLKPVPVQGQNQTIIKEPVPEMAPLGKFLFNVKDQRLLLDSELISLTDKECRVLELLHKNFGELIPRETLMQEVWINEGVITTRSLDMFISKLRKKLSADPQLRITNIHGKGYKLEVTNDFVG